MSQSVVVEDVCAYASQLGWSAIKERADKLRTTTAGKELLQSYEQNKAQQYPAFANRCSSNGGRRLQDDKQRSMSATSETTSVSNTSRRLKLLPQCDDYE